MWKIALNRQMPLQEKERKLAIADPTQARRTIHLGVCGTKLMHFVAVDAGKAQ